MRYRLSAGIGAGYDDSSRLLSDFKLQGDVYFLVGEAGESCAFYIADRLGMPDEMLKTAIRAAYGDAAVDSYKFQKDETQNKNVERFSAMSCPSPMSHRYPLFMQISAAVQVT